MSRPMTSSELSTLWAHALAFNGPFSSPAGKIVKYIDPVIDLRDGCCFSVTFRGYGDTAVVHCCNEFRNVPETLLERCIAFLNSPSWEVV